MTIKQAAFLADNFRDYCVRYNHTPVFFPVYQKGKATEKIRNNPAGFTALLYSFTDQVLQHKRGEADFVCALDTITELYVLSIHPENISYYTGKYAVYHTVHEYIAATDAYLRENGRR